MIVRDAILPNPLLVAETTTVREFCTRVLDSNQTTASVVGDDGLLRGIVSVHDVFRRIMPHYVDMDGKLANVMHEGYFEEKFAEFQDLTVGEIMARDVITIEPDETVIKAVSLLYREGHKSIPVVEAGKFVGTITRRSVLRRVMGRTD